MAAAAAFGEIPTGLASWLFVAGVKGVKEGESTLRKRFELSFWASKRETSWLKGHPKGNQYAV